jgi:hypothetical protein
MVEDGMFPSLKEYDTSPTGPTDCANPPVYSLLSLPPGSADNQVLSILSSLSHKKLILGHIKNDFIFYCEQNSNDVLQSDLSKDTIFFASPAPCKGIVPSSLTILRFLQGQGRKAYFILGEIGYCIEKTENTYALCLELDKLWDDGDFFLEKVVPILGGENYEYNLDNLFQFLMKEYSLTRGLDLSGIYCDFVIFFETIMRDELFLKVSKFDIEKLQNNKKEGLYE